MKCLDSRRLTGPNIVWDRPGAVLDVSFGDADPDRLIEIWHTQVRRMLEAVGWGSEQTAVRRFSTGASLAISAPLDALYAATDINDWAWDAVGRVLSDEAVPLEPDATELRAAIEAESNPRLLALLATAQSHALPAICDDEALTLGLGAGGRTWGTKNLPNPLEVDWPTLHGVPVGLVTGTNGKTTSVRLAAHILRTAGLTPGISSTDWIGVNGDIIDSGDYSGPGGARTVLRDKRVEVAILETARGGLLRRGLGITHADAALITNVAADHLGEFGVEDLPQLADVKWIVTRALDDTSHLILNADDPLLVAKGASSTLNITWFSLDPRNPWLEKARAVGGHICTIEAGWVVYAGAGEKHVLAAVHDIPITLQGAAVHNVANALGVVGLTAALGAPMDRIAEGLRSMRPEDNPGRSNVFHIGGVTVIVDFAHNPHGVGAFLDIGRHMTAERRVMVIGQAGDRSDEDIRGLVRAACALPLDRVVIKGMLKYSRGRPDGETARIIRDEFLAQGYAAEQLVVVDRELDAVAEALDTSKAGDLIMLLIHEDRDAALRYLTERKTGADSL